MEFRFDSVDVSIRGVNKQFKVFNHPGGAAVIAVKGDRILLIEEYRPAVGRKILEIPADLLEPEEDPLSRAQRELRRKLGTKLNSGIRLAQASFSRIQLKLFTFM